jgi:Leucine-rich repeat (LRR) protein
LHLTSPNHAESESTGVLRLGQNQLGGEFPFHLTRNRNLIELRLDQNQLEGTLPPEIDSLRQLQQLYLETNRFQGPLPDIFGRLHLLQVLELQNNTLGQYHDEPEKPARLPTSLGALTNLSKSCHFTSGLAFGMPTFGIST